MNKLIIFVVFLAGCDGADVFSQPINEIGKSQEEINTMHHRIQKFNSENPYCTDISYRVSLPWFSETIRSAQPLNRGDVVKRLPDNTKDFTYKTYEC